MRPKAATMDNLPSMKRDITAKSFSILNYMIGLYLSECFHHILAFNNIHYNVTVNLQKAIKFVVIVNQRTKLDTYTILLSISYYRRVCDKLVENKELVPSSLLCCRKIWLICLMLASKYHNECNYSLLVWSKWTGLSTTDLSEYERIILGHLGYSLNVSSKELHTIKSTLYTKAQKNHSKIVEFIRIRQQLQNLSSNANAFASKYTTATATTTIPTTTTNTNSPANTRRFMTLHHDKHPHLMTPPASPHSENDKLIPKPIPRSNPDLQFDIDDLATNTSRILARSTTYQVVDNLFDDIFATNVNK